MQIVTYDSMFHFGMFIIALIGLILQISHKDKK